MYEFWSNTFTSIFFPINESIWEHMKIIYTSILVGNIIYYILLKLNKIKDDKFLIKLVFSLYLGVIFYLIIFIPVYLYFGENLFFSIGLMIFNYIFIEFFTSKFIKINDSNLVKFLSIVFIIFGYVVFYYLTYFPLDSFLFLRFINCYFRHKK